MSTEVQQHAQPICDTLNATVALWTGVKNVLEQDRALLQDMQSGLRGFGVMSETLTGQQGIAFESAMQQYWSGSQRTEGLLQQLTGTLATCENGMRDAAARADWKIATSCPQAADIVLMRLLPDIPIGDMISYGAAIVDDAANRNRESFLGLVEQSIVADVEFAFGVVTTILALYADEMQAFGTSLNEVVTPICHELSQVLPTVDTADTLVDTVLSDIVGGDSLAEKLDGVPGIGGVRNVMDSVYYVEGAEPLIEWLGDPHRSLLSLADGEASNGLSFLVGKIPVGGEVLGVLTAMQITSGMMSWAENSLASSVAGPGSIVADVDLHQLSANWATTSAHLNVSQVLNDWGAVSVDAVANMASPVLQLVAPQAAAQLQAKSLRDTGAALGATGNMALGVGQFMVNAPATVAADGSVLSNDIIQHMPFPSSFKASSAANTESSVEGMTFVSDLFTPKS